MSGLEGKPVTYRITAQDRDSSTPNGQPGDPVTVTGDGTVDLFQVLVRSGTSAGPWAQAGFDEVAGTRTYDIAVKLGLIPDDVPRVRRDDYESGDTRGAGDDRWDHTAFGTPLRTPLQQDVTINPNKGTVKGKVTDVNTGLPIAGALVEFVSQDPDLAGVTSNTAGTDAAGNYSQSLVYAGSELITVSADRYITQSRTADVPLGGETTQDFALTYQ